MFRELDILTIKWATVDLPEVCRFLLNTKLMFLKKEKDPSTTQFDDDEWIRSLTEAQQVTTDIPEGSVTNDQQDVDPKKVRPIQMREFLRKCVSRRLLALSEGETAAFTTSMRQIGVGTPGGAEGLAMFHQLLHDEWMTGSLIGPLARIKVDEKKLLLGWSNGRQRARRRRGSSQSTWQQLRGNIGTCPMLNRKGSRQCRRIEVQSKETPLECSLALEMVAAETRGSIAARQAAGTLPWIGVNDSAEEQRLQKDHAARLQESVNFQLGDPEKHTGIHDPQHALQKSGILADQWCMDDGDVMHVPPNPGATCSAGFRCRQRQSRSCAGNPLKTEVIYNVNDLGAAPPQWKIDDVKRPLGTCPPLSTAGLATTT